MVLITISWRHLSENVHGCLRAYSGRPANYKRAFVFIVKLKLKPGTTPQFLNAFRKLADHCRGNEPRTLTVSALMQA